MNLTVKCALEKSAFKYIAAYNSMWCEDTEPLFDNALSTAAINTQAECEDICSGDENCRFVLWCLDPAGAYRCATFATCNRRSLYDNGHPNVFKKVQAAASPNESVAAARGLARGPIV